MDNAIGMRINLILKRKHLTQVSFSELLSVGRLTVSNWITGKTSPSYDLLFEIMKIFPEIDGNWLLIGEGNMVHKQETVDTVNDSLLNYNSANTAWNEVIKAKDSIIRDKDDEIKFLRSMLQEKK